MNTSVSILLVRSDESFSVSFPNLRPLKSIVTYSILKFLKLSPKSDLCFPELNMELNIL